MGFVERVLCEEDFLEEECFERFDVVEEVEAEVEVEEEEGFAVDGGVNEDDEREGEAGGANALV